MSKSDAIQEFKHLFLEKTGNRWESWEAKENFEKQPDRFFSLEIDYGIKEAPKKKNPQEKESSLSPKLMELMKMLFDVETYRAAMLEFEINLSEMSLGRLCKKNIQKGFEALTEIQNLINNSNGHEPVVKETLIVDASNRFFTLIPSIHPHVIRDEDDVKAKALPPLSLPKVIVCRLLTKQYPSMPSPTLVCSSGSTQTKGASEEAKKGIFVTNYSYPLTSLSFWLRQICQP